MTDLHRLVSRLDVSQKVALLTSATFWSTRAVPSIGLRSMLVSDGPSGVRGEFWDERDPSLGLPSATTLAASWDVDLLARHGAVCAAEARRKGVDVVLGPMINLQRSPLGGRHFETFAEDPMLTGALAAAYVGGVQSGGVAATPKHYIANDSETDRFTVDVDVDDRTLREVYLRPFEDAVEAGAWLVMSSYNSVAGRRVTESPLLDSPLKEEWGFDGVVISDWSAVRSVESARVGQDLVFPGPRGPWGDRLVDEVLAGRIPEPLIDDKVLRILRLADRVGALGHERSAAVTGPPMAEDGASFARRAAAAGTVLMHNDGLLPLRKDLASLAVIGDNAAQARAQGGGSATVLPEHEVSPLEGLRAAFGERVRFARGAVVQEGIRPFDRSLMRNPATGAPGLRAIFQDAAGQVLKQDDRAASDLVWLGDAPVAESATLTLTTRLTVATDQVRVGVHADGQVTIRIDGTEAWTGDLGKSGQDLGASFHLPEHASVPIDAPVGESVMLEVEYVLPTGDRGDLSDLCKITVGTEEDTTTGDDLIAEACRLAADSEVAVVVVGTNERVESEGRDRSDLTLPGRQDELVRAVVASNPRTVVVVNAGAPVQMPWRHDVAAVLVSWFGGQEMGHAVADIVIGQVEPGGRLTHTWPEAMDDSPVLDVAPVDGRLVYSEGIHVGYRGWLRTERTPAFPFGYGLGYTTWRVDEVDAVVGPAEIVVSCRVSNTGDRVGKHVVQVYAGRTDSAVDRPQRWLVGFAAVQLGPGEQRPVEVVVPHRELRHWDDGWHVEPGRYVLHVGTSVLDISHSREVMMRGEGSI